MSLTGQIKRVDNMVTCDVLNCMNQASFKWFFQSESGTMLAPLHGDNIVSYVGMGKYICNVVCGEVSAVYSAMVMDGTIQEHVYAQITTQEVHVKNTNSAWDFNKLPKDKSLKAKIKEHFERSEWKQLAIIHNRFELSDKTICCDMSDVQKNFATYVENLPAPKSKVVRGTK